MQPETNFHAAAEREIPEGTVTQGAASDREAERARVIEAARLQRVLQYLALVIGLAMVACFATCAGPSMVVWGVAVGVMILAAFAAEVVNFKLQLRLRAGWFSLFVTGAVLWLVVVVTYPTGGLMSALGAVAVVCFIDSALGSGRVSRLLKKAGVRVGLFGASNEELRRLQTGVCFHCGYDMAGLPTPVCPECGKESRIGARA